MFRRRLFGYSKKDVLGRIEDYENLIDLQRRDIDYLKRDNDILKSTITNMTKDDRREV